MVASCIGFGNDGRMEVRFPARLGWNLGCFLPQGRGPRGFPLCDSAALGMWTRLVITRTGRTWAVVAAAPVTTAATVSHASGRGVGRGRWNLFLWKPVWFTVKTLFS